MKYSKTQLKAALREIYPPADKILEKDIISLPKICDMAARHAFLSQVPESPNTRLLRQAAKDISDDGYFKFSPEG